MIAIGGAIGTGLFLGSSLAVRIAGPGVIVSYLIGAVIALLFMGALSEMAVAHPTAGSFGVYAELYLNPWAGFAVRYTYWAAQCIAIGGEATAIAIYCQWWFPNTPQVAVDPGVFARAGVCERAQRRQFRQLRILVRDDQGGRHRPVHRLGVALLLRHSDPAPAIGFSNFTAHGGFLPNGLARRVDGDGLRDLQLHGNRSGRSHGRRSQGTRRPPCRAPCAPWSGRLILFYLGAIAVLIGIVPWNQIQPGADVTASPFVRSSS